jgi:CO/xanthine dehydrogenase Mo-binding subunit
MTTGNVGRPAGRIGGLDRVTGRQRYVADLRLDDALHVKLVTLPCARAWIVDIDTSKAWEVPGVRTIFTAADLPDPMPRYGVHYDDRPVLAVGETKFHGEPVAAVAADTLDAAQRAAALVQVQYEELPPVLDVRAALDPAAPLVVDPVLRPDDPLASTNIRREFRYAWGDVDTATADLVIENTYTFPMVTHFAIEPHGFVVAADESGVTVWSSIQHPYILQRVMARVLGLPLSRVRVIAPDPGGAFGGKGYPKFEPLLAYMAMATGRPCRLVLTLEETFQAVRRNNAEVRIRTGFDSDGTIRFQDIEADFLMGAYVDISARVISKSSHLAAGPYRVPNARILARALHSHTPPSTAMRGFGTPQFSWALEQQMDEAARRLDMDRLEIRLRNLARKGEEFIPGDTPADGDWFESVRRAADAIGWGEPLPDGRGRGLAVGIKSSATAGAAYSILRFLYDGSVFVLVGTSDMGQGARTILTQIVSDELGVPPEAVNVVMGDTAAAPFDYSTSASRSTVFMGGSVMRGCAELKDQVREMAARLRGCEPEEIEIDRGVVTFPGGEQKGIVEVVQEGLGAVGGELIAVGLMRGEADPNHPIGGRPWFYEFNCTAVELEVDRRTGEVLIHKHVTVADVGKAINPQHVESQDEGAAIMGLGHTLMEHLVLDEHGRIVNLGALDYRIPTTKDMPLELESIIVENGDGPGPHGAKGVGEGGLLCVAAAVASAVTDATGVVIRDLPLTPERIWRAINEVTPSEVSP